MFELRTSGAEVFHFAELSSYKGVSEGIVYMVTYFCCRSLAVEKPFN